MTINPSQATLLSKFAHVLDNESKTEFLLKALSGASYDELEKSISDKIGIPKEALGEDDE